MTLIHDVLPESEAQSGNATPPETSNIADVRPADSLQADAASPQTDAESPVLEEINPDVENDTSATAEVFDSTFMDFIFPDQIPTEYVAASACCSQVTWMQHQLLDYGLDFQNTSIFWR